MASPVFLLPVTFIRLFQAHSRSSPPAPATWFLRHWCSWLIASNPLCQSEAKVKGNLEPQESVPGLQQEASSAGWKTVTLCSS